MKVLRTTSKYPWEVNEISWNNSGDLFFITTGKRILYSNILLIGKLIIGRGTVEAIRGHDFSLKNAKSIQAHTANIYCLKFDPTGR
jgi:THO complex subunit 3